MSTLTFLVALSFVAEEMAGTCPSHPPAAFSKGRQQFLDYCVNAYVAEQLKYNMV